jgi:hypothetical protein
VALADDDSFRSVCLQGPPKDLLVILFYFKVFLQSFLDTPGFSVCSTWCTLFIWYNIMCGSLSKKRSCSKEWRLEQSISCIRVFSMRHKFYFVVFSS